MHYKLSVIIPVYNGEKYLKTAIDSLINQTLGFENIELIIIDDHSTDNTKDIITYFSSKYNNIFYVFLEENSGTASTPRNIGIKNVSSDYIMFLDVDDIFYPEMCEVMHSTIKNNNVDIVSCRYKQLFKSKITEVPLDYTNKFKKRTIIKSYDDPELYLTYPLLWNKIFSKEFILENNIKFPDGLLFGDLYFTLLSFNKSKNIYLLNDFFGYQYNKTNDSITNVCTKKSFNKWFKGFILIMEMIEESGVKSLENVRNAAIAFMFKYFFYCDLCEKSINNFFIESIHYFKVYDTFFRIKGSNIFFNMFLNFLIKLSSLNKFIPKIIHKFYRKQIRCK